MAREYKEYRSVRAPHPKENKRKHRFLRKIFKQFVFAIIIFSAIYFFRLSASEKINDYIKNAFLYDPDTTFITDTVKNILKTTAKDTKKEGAQNESTQETLAEEVL
ncbi:MAG: hypothetical protein IJW15_05725 [Clostridia bacterium]|nr:hypothetical protein [Clostridia bacterium]